MPTALIEKAIREGRSVLNEYESKRILERYGVPVAKEILLSDGRGLPEALRKIGFPVVMKACSAHIAHKTEKDLIRMNIASVEEANRAFLDIRAAMEDLEGGVLIQETIKGIREVVVGMTRDAQFGPCVMFGLGGVFTEILEDVSFRRAPLTREDALSMMTEIRGAKILDAVRGMEAVRREDLADILAAVGRIALDHGGIQEIDVNPIIIRKGKPVAVDALMILRR